MLSRVADNLYWMSRYLERAEHTARILDVNLNLMLDESSSSVDRRWQRVLAALGNPINLAWNGDAYQVAHVLTFDSSNRSSITSCITSARENARQVREEISSEQWQRVNRLFHQVAHYNLTESLDVLPSEFLLSVIEGIHLFQGVTDSTMGHGEGWQFIQVGRYIERASATASLLNLYHREFWGQAGNPAEGSEYLEWIGLLRSCTAFEAYCKTYTADLNPDRILEFLLLNPEFPHAVRYSIDCLQTALDAIHGEGGKRRASPLTRLAGRLQASLGFGQISEILSEDVGSYLQGILYQCRDIHEMIYQIYVNYSIQSALAG
jgi:uncharacterized alpha-E superfamily protein